MYKKGDRIRLISSSDPYTSLTCGDEGTVTDVSKCPSPTPPIYETMQVWVDWDNGSTLAMLPVERGGDRIEKIS